MNVADLLIECVHQLECMTTMPSPSGSSTAYLSRHSAIPELAERLCPPSRARAAYTKITDRGTRLGLGFGVLVGERKVGEATGLRCRQVLSDWQRLL